MNEIEEIRSRIHTIRGKQVMLDKDLAELYGVEVKRLNEAVKRNIERFPDDFMFQLKQEEWEILKSQFATSSWGGTRKLPFAFTEQGVAMLSGVLRSPIAVEVNIEEVLADANDRDEMMEKKIDKIENTIDILQADVAMLQANLYQEEQEPREKRIFEMEVKGFKKKE